MAGGFQLVFKLVTGSKRYELMKAALRSRQSGGGMRWFHGCLAAGALLLTGLSSGSRAADPPSAAAILQDLHSFNELGSVLHIAAHPDDENTQLITYLVRGRGCRTAYLSITRGDGGQNLLGPEFGETLGVLRTQELLSARRLDGGRQFFTRAIDFGFSKDAYKTLETWGHQEVLGDVVRVIRTFQPDLIITKFSTMPSGTHGHHTASGILGVEAFTAAADPKAYPEQLNNLAPWKAKRVLLNGGGFGAKAGGKLQLDVGGTDSELNISFGEIAGRSRAMHKTQGFGNFGGGAGGGKKGGRTESFQVVEGVPATKDIFEGIDTTWGRIKGGAVIGTLTEKAITQFDAKNPAGSVPVLLEISKNLANLPDGMLVNEKRVDFERILAACLGLQVETAIAEAEVVAGETLKLRHTATLRANVPVRWVATRYPRGGKAVASAIDLRPNEPSSRESVQTLAANTPLSQPYWLREDHGVGMYKVADPNLIGRPENPPVFPVEHVFDIGGQVLMIADEPMQRLPGEKNKETRRRMEVIPPVALHFTSNVALVPPGGRRPVTVEVTAYRTGIVGQVSLDVPSGWSVSPPEQQIQLKAIGDKSAVTFNVTAPAAAATGSIQACALIGGIAATTGRLDLHYDHLPRLLLQPPARLKTLGLDLAIHGQNVGYLPGAGDSVAECLTEMGYKVRMLTGKDLTPEGLRGLDAVVTGVRAFNTRKDLTAGIPALFAFVEKGGNLIVQYNRPNGLLISKLLPFDLGLSQSRVTDKDAKITFLAPEHPAMNTPNKITVADFEGWVQERAIYFPSQWDKRFTPLLACNDPGDAPQKGGLLVGQHGKGYLVYTSYSWFRQLPEGVPGAYRIFANLVSLGK